ncbi:MAG TPA: hypothetical protein VLE71_02560 [Actinomycetota bacterium]|nr:hypothetical protein [Actinomycetota bacterium]
MGRLDGYLNDHLAGSAAAIQLVQRCWARQPESELGRVLRVLLGEIEEDRRVLEHVIGALGGSANPLKRAGALGVELLSSLRMALPILGAGAAEAARLEEIEVLSLGIEGKRLLWAALGTLATSDARLQRFDFAALQRRAKAQRDRLERYRLELAAAAMRNGVG